MTKDTYIKITGIIRDNPRRVRLTLCANRVLTGFVFLFYPIFLLTLFLQKNGFWLRAAIVCGISFVGLSAFRRAFDSPRPYEKFGIPPVLPKETAGKSFPSRHVFSVFIIASTVFFVSPAAGIVLGITGIALGVIRVIGGVHEPRDVITGALLGIACGLAGCYIF